MADAGWHDCVAAAAKYWRYGGVAAWLMPVGMTVWLQRPSTGGYGSVAAWLMPVGVWQSELKAIDELQQDRLI